VLGSVVYLGRHGEGIFAGGFFAAVIATAVAAEGTGAHRMGRHLCQLSNTIYIDHKTSN
jgi:hypothetical protein